MVQHQMDPAVSWVADTLDYESVPVLQRSASAGGGPREEALRSRFWCAMEPEMHALFVYFCIDASSPSTSPFATPSQLHRRARALLKLLTTVVAAVAIGATAAAMHATIDGVVGWRNAILRSFFRRGSLLQVGHPSSSVL